MEALGWNRYGGWRIGIRSFDKKRYYYYAHLRQNRPYAEGLKEGDYVTAGDVIGYMGHTGYSDKENVNNIKTVHLHVGLQLIFDESQKDGNNEIWIDCYEITRFLAMNRAETVKKQETKELQNRRGCRRHISQCRSAKNPLAVIHLVRTHDSVITEHAERSCGSVKFHGKRHYLKQNRKGENPDTDLGKGKASAPRKSKFQSKDNPQDNKGQSKPGTDIGGRNKNRTDFQGKISLLMLYGMTAFMGGHPDGCHGS